jgi:hypothetical protein
MNTKLQLKTKVTLFALAAGAAMFAGSAIGDESQALNSGDVESMSKWHGRAGGLTGSDAVSAARTSGAKVSVTYDKDVAERTNMTREPAEGKNIGVTYDKDVADRTNMTRSKTAPDSVKAATAPASESKP